MYKVLKNKIIDMTPLSIKALNNNFDYLYQYLNKNSINHVDFVPTRSKVLSVAPDELDVIYCDDTYEKVTFTRDGDGYIDRYDGIPDFVDDGKVNTKAYGATVTYPDPTFLPPTIHGTPYNLRRTFSHTSILLPDGNILIVGGNSSFDLGDNMGPDLGTDISTDDLTNLGNTVHNLVSIFNTTTYLVTDIATLVKNRFKPIIGFLPNGDLIVAAGEGRNDIGTVEILSMTTFTSNIVGNLTCARQGCAGVLMKDGNLIIAGGHRTGDSGDLGYELTSVEVYNTITNVSSIVGQMLSEKADFNATALKNGKILFSGDLYHSSVELYNPTNNTSVAIIKTDDSSYYMPPGIFTNQATVLLRSGNIVFIGGRSRPLLFFVSLKKITLYPSPEGSKKFVEIGEPDLNYSRFNHTATLLLNGDILIIGGCGIDYTGVGINFIYSFPGVELIKTTKFKA